MNLLVAEDDCLLNNTLCYNLSIVGYSVDSAMTKSEAVRFCEKQEYDLIVLDVILTRDKIYQITYTVSILSGMI